MRFSALPVLTYWFSAPPLSGKPLAVTPTMLRSSSRKSHQLQQHDGFSKGLCDNNPRLRAGLRPYLLD
jgi:hypothetical protein